MSLQDTPRGERIHIALFGRRNAGKSSLINALTGQQISIVSDVAGTTTDPVFKSMELLPIGPVVMIDTPGLDDEGELGMLRIERAQAVLEKTDVAIVAADSQLEIGDFERSMIDRIKERKIPLVLVLNKSDLAAGRADLASGREDLPAGHGELSARILSLQKELHIPVVAASGITGEGIDSLKQTLIHILPDEEDKFHLVGDLLSPSDIVVLVVPIDKAAPKGRLILPQQQTIRDILEADAMAIITKEYELKDTLLSLAKKPRLVITDSQVFAKVSADTPRDIPLTSFSILFARYKGDLPVLVRGAKTIDTLADGDKILIAEGCTHHRQCDDIGTVKLPRWIRQHTGKDIEFVFTSGGTYPSDLTPFRMIVHCGACMLNRREMHFRIRSAENAGIPIVNYGVLIAYMQGILPRVLEPFPLAALELE
jgi:[FeFe] hydrogenase H-cluster maturation GTPase HydF